MIKFKRREILERLRDYNPRPESELEFNSPFELLVAVQHSGRNMARALVRATALSAHD